MILNILYILLALLGLGFLIFIHELGHYWMARKVGMKVEEFTIGFGKALKVWDYQGVKWKICILPFGGQVRIKGEEESENGREVEGGYLSKHPKDRILVALMGPLVNFAFAFFAFTLLWLVGGRMQSFSAHTKIIGYVQSNSESKKAGLAPGDEIVSVAGIPFASLKDAQISSVVRSKFAEFSYLKVGQDTPETKKIALTKGQASPLSEVYPAQFLIYSNTDERGVYYPLSDKGPAHEAGILPQDQIVWANGQIIYHLFGLQKVVNTPTTFLTILRDGKIFQSNIPRVLVKHLNLSEEITSNIDDWRYTNNLAARTSDLFFIPYEVNHDLSIGKSVGFINKKAEEDELLEQRLDKAFIPLQKGDKIVAVNGVAITSAEDLLNQIQEQRVLVIVKRKPTGNVIWKNEDALLKERLQNPLIAKLAARIGTKQAKNNQDDYILLQPIVAKATDDLVLTDSMRALREDLYQREKDDIEAIEDPQIKERMLQRLDKQKKSLKLGLAVQDLAVQYNPGPLQLFVDALNQTWFCLKSLFIGALSPKNLSGPVGIIYVIQASIASSAKDGLYWLGFISLNLAFLNLLPIPVLDGGHICFSLWEWVTGKKIRAKTMQKIIIPFFILLIGFFIFVTFQDLSNLFHRFF